jgi:hypothetical protein
LTVGFFVDLVYKLNYSILKKFLLALIGSILINTINAQNMHTNKSDTSAITIDGDNSGIAASDIHDHDLKQKNTTYIYPGYIIKIHNFNVFNDKFGNSPSNYNGDESKVVLSQTDDGSTTIRIKKDSININDDPNSNLERSVIQIISMDKKDGFKIYYTSDIELSKLISHKSYEYTESSGPSSFITEVVDKKITSSYKLLISHAKYFYHIPKIESFVYGENEGSTFKEIKTRLHAQEKIIADKLAHVKIRALIYQNKPYTLNPKGICFRIERYVNGKCKSTKYLEIDFEEYD